MSKWAGHVMGEGWGVGLTLVASSAGLALQSLDAADHFLAFALHAKSCLTQLLKLT